MEHVHHAKSSAKFLDADEILNELGLEGSETFMDLGCGDGYISIRAIEEYLPDGCVYAVDAYDVAISELNDYVSENNLSNLIPLEADVTEGIKSLDDGSMDVIFMLNLFHGFKPSGEMGTVIEELSRLIGDDGKIVVMDFKPVDMKWGPPKEIRLSCREMEEIFNKHGLEKVYVNDDIGDDVAQGKSHYLMIFKKE